MGSAAPESTRLETGSTLVEKAERLARVIAGKDVVLLTGATTGIVYVVGKTAHDAGCFHIGIYTGFGLKGRNVVLVRSCDIVLFVAGAMGSLNEFTIAHDERKVIGCLRGTGGVADDAEVLLQKFGKRSTARVFMNEDPEQLLTDCLNNLKST
jgi:predicted Rossmann-fold nucleotide-binding protein